MCWPLLNWQEAEPLFCILSQSPLWKGWAHCRSVGQNKVQWVEAVEKRFPHRWEELHYGQSCMYQNQFGTAGGIQALPGQSGML